MSSLLIRLFVKNSQDTQNPDVRASYGNMSGIVGIILNLSLFMLKLMVGIFSMSISVIADAFNNLSDAGGSVVTFLGFRLARRPADSEHPFGHGRYEYITGLGISILILFVGFELVKSSVGKIFNPEAVTQVSLFSVLILSISAIVKIWMFFFNRKISKLIDSSALKATAMDSLSDSIATSVVLIGLLISKITSVNIDGWLGVAVALFIIFAGINAFKDSISPLLGNPPSEEFVNDIKETVLDDEIVVGIHDLMVHDYGPGRCIISLHAEVPCDEDILKAHDAIDLIEKKLECKYNCLATIHMDPVAVNDEYTVELKESVISKITEIDNSFSIHDFRIVRGETHTNLIFDLEIPFQCKMPSAEIFAKAKEKIKQLDPSFIPVMHIDKV